MGKLTIDIPNGTHHHIKVLAANQGITIKEYILDRIMPELTASVASEPSLRELAKAWEERRKDFRLERGDRRARDLIHDGHKW